MCWSLRLSVALCLKLFILYFLAFYTMDQVRKSKLKTLFSPSYFFVGGEITKITIYFQNLLVGKK